MKTEILDKIKLDKSYINYNKIINLRLPYKFSYLDDWLLKNSKLLLEEAKNNEVKNYYKYERGTIIKVDFGVGLGSEMSQVHFAIVLNKYDNYKNNILTVVPLTSTKGKFNLNLKTLIHDLIKDIEKELENCDQNNIIKIKKLHNVLDYYKSIKNYTYACCNLVTIISKTRILSRINEYDIIGRKKCSKEILDLLDSEIKNRFTN